VSTGRRYRDEGVLALIHKMDKRKAKPRVHKIFKWYEKKSKESRLLFNQIDADGLFATTKIVKALDDAKSNVLAKFI
jgi:single-stranded DNA-specific DHH superfamily exonuclease